MVTMSLIYTKIQVDKSIYHLKVPRQIMKPMTSVRWHIRVGKKDCGLLEIQRRLTNFGKVNLQRQMS